MGFWIFMLVGSLIIPLTMIGFGSHFIKRAPKEINDVFGYRTSMSTKNNDTWAFAHQYCGKLWRAIGWIMLPLSIGAMLFVIGRETGFVGTYGGIWMGIQCVLLVVPIIPTEMALRKSFDQYGNRKE